MRWLPLALVPLVVTIGCSEDEPSQTQDAGVADASVVDSGTQTLPDATVDGGTVRDSGTTPEDAGPRPQSILILHTNDEHSQHIGVGPNVDDIDSMPDPNGGGRQWVDINTSSGTGDIHGGLKRRAALLARLKRDSTADATLIAGAGDVTMGSIFHLANAFRGIDYSIATALRYDALTLGNHEFDFGLDVLETMITTGGLSPDPEVVTPLEIPLVVSNIHFSTSTVDDGIAALYGANKPIRRTHIKTIAGMKVGFVGYMGLGASMVAPFKRPIHFSLAATTNTCDDDLDCPRSVCLTPTDNPTATQGTCAVNVDETDFATHMPALVADVASAVAELRAQNVDLVVAVSHAGVEEREINLLTAMGQPLDAAQASEDILVAVGVDTALEAAGVPGIDVIVGGHTHTLLERPLSVPNRRSGITTFIGQAGSYGQAVGRIRLTRPTPTAPWTLESDESTVVPVDDRVDASDLNTLTEFLIDTAVNSVLEGFESNPAGSHGDGLLFPGEACDEGPSGPELPNQGQCVGVVPGATGGTLACYPNSQLNLSGCVLAVCNHNGTVDAGEMCDHGDLGTQPTCEAHGYVGGVLGCTDACTYDFRRCEPFLPSFAEIGVNFGRQGAPVLDDSGVNGDLVFGYEFGQTSFDLRRKAFQESNLLNFVTDAERQALNDLADLADPVRVVVSANGILRDDILQGDTGKLSLADLFRVLPLGVSPRERTPGFNIAEFYLLPMEVRAGLEIGVTQGLLSDDFWTGTSGLRFEYDPSRPVFDPARPFETGRITKMTLTTTTGQVWQDNYEAEPIFDIDRPGGPMPDPARLIHVATSVYLGLVMESQGLCPRTENGDQMPQCQVCTMSIDCPFSGTTCDNPSGSPNAGHCVDSVIPGVVLRAAVQKDTVAELKEVLALMYFVRTLPKQLVPPEYDGPTPQRACCVGSQCVEGTVDRRCPD